MKWEACMSKGFDFNCSFSKLTKCSHLMYGISLRKWQRRKMSAFFCRLPAAAIHGGRVAFERGSICGVQTQGLRRFLQKQEKEDRCRNLNMVLEWCLQSPLNGEKQPLTFVTVAVTLDKISGWTICEKSLKVLTGSSLSKACFHLCVFFLYHREHPILGQKSTGQGQNLRAD